MASSDSWQDLLEPRKSSTEKLLESFDFETFRQIVREELRRSDADVRAADRISEKRIKILKNDRRNEGAAYKPLTGNILLPKRLARSGELHQTLVLSHEMAHQVSSSPCFKDAPLSNLLRIVNPLGKMKSGYASSSTFTVFELFNEGVTELISRELALEYFKRTGTEVPEKYKKRLADQFDTGDGYFYASILVMAFVDAMTEKTNVEREAVWRSIKKHYFTGGLDTKTRTMIDDIFGGEFIKELSKLKGKHEVEPMRMRNFIEKHLRAHIPSQFADSFDIGSNDKKNADLNKTG